MSEITHKEFAAAVNAAMSSVIHLNREVIRLIVGLRDSLGGVPGTAGADSRDAARRRARQYDTNRRPERVRRFAQASEPG